jgi:hypothetical protein
MGLGEMFITKHETIFGVHLASALGSVIRRSLEWMTWLNVILRICDARFFGTFNSFSGMVVYVPCKNEYYST